LSVEIGNGGATIGPVWTEGVGGTLVETVGDGVGGGTVAGAIGSVETVVGCIFVLATEFIGGFTGYCSIVLDGMVAGCSGAAGGEAIVAGSGLAGGGGAIVGGSGEGAAGGAVIEVSGAGAGGGAVGAGGGAAGAGAGGGVVASGAGAGGGGGGGVFAGGVFELFISCMSAARAAAWAGVSSARVRKGSEPRAMAIIASESLKCCIIVLHFFTTNYP
jgi:hypothetical protein